MTEIAYLYMGSVVRATMSEYAWRSLGEDDHHYLITQLRDQGAVAIGGSLIQKDGSIGFAGSFSVAGSIFEILYRLSLENVNLLTSNSVAPFTVTEQDYNSPPVEINLIRAPE